MNKQINERIEIAQQYKSIYNWKGKPDQSKTKSLRSVALFNYGIVVILLFIVVFASALSTLKIELFLGKWTNAALLVLMTMGLSLRSPFSYIELLLHNHIKRINPHTPAFDQNINLELDNLINSFNNRRRYLILTGIPIIVIILSSFLQVFDLNPYWDRFPPLVLLVSLYLLVRINTDVFKLRKNIAWFEAEVS